MNKAGFVVSLFGGIFAVLFSVLLVVTGPYFFAGSDITAFLEKNNDELFTMWNSIGLYNDVPVFWESDMDDYIDGYSKALQKMDTQDLRGMGDEYNIKAFDSLARIYGNMEEYLPLLKICVIACLSASVLALIGAAAAKAARVAGGVMVLLGAAALLVFSLLASSILSMAAAALLLMIGGLLQMAKPKARGEVAK